MWLTVALAEVPVVPVAPPVVPPVVPPGVTAPACCWVPVPGPVGLAPVNWKELGVKAAAGGMEGGPVQQGRATLREAN